MFLPPCRLMPRHSNAARKLCQACRTIHAVGKCRLKKERLPPRKRGYDRDYEKFRAGYFADPDNWHCKDCGVFLTTWDDGKGTGKELHHIKKVEEFPELRLERTNAMGLCKRCHSIRTRRGE